MSEDNVTLCPLKMAGDWVCGENGLAASGGEEGLACDPRCAWHDASGMCAMQRVAQSLAGIAWQGAT